jgi:hypothetical protein
VGKEGEKGMLGLLLLALFAVWLVGFMWWDATEYLLKRDDDLERRDRRG